MTEVIFTGYHGTSPANGECILSEKTFKLSKSDEEWLGTGIYFYDKYADALNWKGVDGELSDEKMILHVVIRVNEDEYIDLDTEEGKKELRQTVDSAIKIAEKLSIKIDKKMVQKNQCAIMNYLWKIYPKTKLVFDSFPNERSRIYLLSDPRESRREMCVKDNSSIFSIEKIEEW